MNERRRIPGPNLPATATPDVPGAQKRIEQYPMQPPASTTPIPGLQRLALPVTSVGNIAKGICGVMAEVGTIKKGGYNKFHNYNYARLEDLLEAITPLMGRHGICVIQNEIERATAENRILVTYEFSIIHTSGEVWPERPRFTGMSIGRDSKGNYDDKAINKCHSAARKYFLLSLFQVPSGDFDDADASTQSPPVPVPQRPAPPPVPRAAPTPAPTSVPKPTPTLDEFKPHRIVLGQGAGAEGWATEYIKRIGSAKTTQEMTEWDGLNDTILQMVSDRFPDVYSRIFTATERRMSDLGSSQVEAETIDAETGEVSDAVTSMPNPGTQPQEAVNWVAQQLSDLNTIDARKAFWDQMVLPRKLDFFPPDWDALLSEYMRVTTP